MSGQVEALFLQMMLKSMRDAASADGELDSNETGMYQDMFDKQVALTLTNGKTSASRGCSSGSWEARVRRPRRVAPAAAQTGPAATGASRCRWPPRSAYDHGTAGRAIRQRSTTDHPPRGPRLGVNPLGMLAQAALETGWGQRMARTADGTPA